MVVRLKKPLEVEISRITSLASGSIAMTGAEQTLLEQPDGIVSRVSGYIDLTNLAGGDTLIIRMYIRVVSGGAWRLYHQDGYNGPVAPAVVHVVERPENHGLRLTLQQTAGVNKVIDYEFYQEV